MSGKILRQKACLSACWACPRSPRHRLRRSPGQGRDLQLPAAAPAARCPLLLRPGLRAAPFRPEPWAGNPGASPATWSHGLGGTLPASAPCPPPQGLVRAREHAWQAQMGPSASHRQPGEALTAQPWGARPRGRRGSVVAPCLLRGQGRRARNGSDRKGTCLVGAAVPHSQMGTLRG